MTFKPTKDALLEPRDCSKCGRFMDREFLERKRKEMSDKMKEARKKREEMRRRVFNRE